MDTTQWIGIAAGVLTSVSMLPQLIKIIKEKKAGDVSVVMLLVLIGGACTLGSLRFYERRLAYYYYQLVFLFTQLRCSFF